jgi:2-polyprenyl-3-methyl-5-hydroxy-6-metoxy-1,4-benzoquinol methylase
MAVPSYDHWNPLIRWLFWKRLDTALELAAPPPGCRVFEFGVGSGVLLPTYRTFASRVAVTDLHLAPAREMARRADCSAEFVESSAFPEWVGRNRGDFDVVFALDVLEHVGDEELTNLSRLFGGLLKSEGALIVSGPTETVFYKLGRLIAGFRNEYHRRNIFDIDRELQADWRTEDSRLIPRRPLPQAFLLTRYRRRGAA